MHDEWGGGARGDLGTAALPSRYRPAQVGSGRTNQQQWWPPVRADVPTVHEARRRVRVRGRTSVVREE
jgi:hypothetical protein